MIKFGDEGGCEIVDNRASAILKKMLFIGKADDMISLLRVDNKISHDLEELIMRLVNS